MTRGGENLATLQSVESRWKQGFDIWLCVFISKSPRDDEVNFAFPMHSVSWRLCSFFCLFMQRHTHEGNEQPPDTEVP